MSAAATSKATHTFRIDVLLDSPAGTVLYGGSAVFRDVPIDAALEQQAIQWITPPEPATREQGAEALAHVREHRAAREAAARPAAQDLTENDKPTVRRYFVRKRAHVLRACVPHTTPPIDANPR